MKLWKGSFEFFLRFTKIEFVFQLVIVNKFFVLMVGLDTLPYNNLAQLPSKAAHSAVLI